MVTRGVVDGDGNTATSMRGIVDGDRKNGAAAGDVVKGDGMSRGRGKAIEALLSTQRGQRCWRRIGRDVVVSRQRQRLLNC